MIHSPSGLSATDYFFFLVLDIGNATMEAIPVGVRFAIGVLQSCAVRSAGFATVPLASLAPAVQCVTLLMIVVFSCLTRSQDVVRDDDVCQCL